METGSKIGFFDTGAHAPEAVSDAYLEADLDAMAIHDFRLGKPQALNRMSARNLWDDLEQSRVDTKTKIDIEH